MEQEEWRIEVLSGQVDLISNVTGETFHFTGPDRLLTAMNQKLKEEGKRLEFDTPPLLADQDRRAGLQGMLASAIKIEDQLCEILVEDGQRLKRATALRKRLDGALAALSATETVQNASGVYGAGFGPNAAHGASQRVYFTADGGIRNAPWHP